MSDIDRTILVATTSVLAEYEGRPLYIHKGVTTVRAGHPLLETFGERFEPLKPTFEVDEDQESDPEAEDAAAEEESAVSEAEDTVVAAEPSETPGESEAAPAAVAPDPAPKDVRAWAAEQGIEVSPKGKIPADVVEQYQAAHTEA